MDETKATLIMEENSNEIISGGNVSDLKTNYYISYNSVRTLPDTGEYNSLNYLFMGEILLILLFVLVMYKKTAARQANKYLVAVFYFAIMGVLGIVKPASVNALIYWARNSSLTANCLPFSTYMVVRTAKLPLPKSTIPKISGPV